MFEPYVAHAKKKLSKTEGGTWRAGKTPAEVVAVARAGRMTMSAGHPTRRSPTTDRRATPKTGEWWIHPTIGRQRWIKTVNPISTSRDDGGKQRRPLFGVSLSLSLSLSVPSALSSFQPLPPCSLPFMLSDLFIGQTLDNRLLIQPPARSHCLPAYWAERPSRSWRSDRNVTGNYI